MIIKLLLLTCVVVFIIDLSGIIEELERILGKWLKAKIVIPKPISCSLCMTWWIGLIYIIVCGYLNLPYIAYVALLSFLTTTIYNILILIRDIVNKIITITYKYLKL